MQTVRRNPLERAIVAVCSLVLWLTTAVIFLILTANTVLRYVSGSSLQWANELPELLFPWLVMAGVVMAAEKGAHIATVFLVEAVPPAARRVIGVLGWLVVAGLYATLAWATLSMLEIVHDEKSPILQVPGSVTYGCVMGGMVMLALLAAQSAWRVFQSDGALPAASIDPQEVHW
ncbi:MAG TPA: TRAP transporter small permease [Hydrogenophaga sp.]|uniref:TRAP transporter small permease n=1 Tax=Hydrogenophaga sp. TaxID=1904254 RepID=UPI0008C3000C|nr:TRAP transporter small permease [Hydrogenophaga sp.]OGA73582.1 MAG: C4-dicarboxylate ABC transporter permease [Burkholderiales bacterium GWE1_65_30]OGA92076.1 MAG: C4-dicarboxylate ABC transporter permease [Burkholderiales bacterium GWF1_66_17]OGB20289.1 MAG: C4-dicarboxylate ABC transporter permease [Burkholderiales bacterium RIFCSPHIGHO2_02_FULL_66_10]OGB37162.1 MAG: C4-dicarboxylate ABC transporter permease [Burkholderiales bacterium RIFCSPLOWO2_02_FULL_66_35]HAX23206.1 TRAP transporter 